MIVIFYGTGAELIKMYGIIKSVPRKQQLLICTAQQYSGLQKVHQQLDIHPDMYLAKGWKGKDVENMKQMAGLMMGAHSQFALQLRNIRSKIKQNKKEYSTKSIVLVHGDTLTTVVGSYLGKLLGVPVGHVEAGLRSGSWKSPFPEEINRRVVSKIARVHFPPNQLAEENLRNEKTRGEIINTTYNTAKDAIDQADKFISKEFTKLRLPKHYLLTLLHRTELLENRQDLEDILVTLRTFAEEGNDIVFTMHSTTQARIESYDFSHYLEHPHIHVISKQPYFDFMAIVKGADAVVTDGGGLQEDTFFLGIPAIIHRARTERQEGIGRNSSLSGMDITKVSAFLRSHPVRNRSEKPATSISPSAVVVEYLADHHFITETEGLSHA